jgi:hypothetical protein
MITPVVALLLLAAPPPPATVAALGCKDTRCQLVAHPASTAGTVWEVTRVGLRREGDTACHEDLKEWWLVKRDGQSQKLLTICNDGYGASGVGEDTVELKGTTFTHSRSGGSAWRWSQATLLELDPLRVVSEETTSFHASMPNLESSTAWSWPLLRGTWSASVPPCEPDETPDFETERPLEVRGSLIPQVTLPEAFRGGDWKTTALGDCSAAAGFVTFGAQAGAGDASLRVVTDLQAQRRELYVEVRDDVFVEKAADKTRWTTADHLELWLASAADPWQACSGRKGGLQWGVTLDGDVHSAFGGPKPSTLGVEVARAEGVVRFKLLLPVFESWYRIAVVYSDSDDGRHQKALLATSQLKFASEVTFSPWQVVQPAVAVCEEEAGVLKPMTRRVLTPGEAVIE